MRGLGPMMIVSVFVESRHFLRLMLAFLLFTAIHIVGTVGYVLLGPEGTTGFDALYMTFITVATIGFGEVVDLTGNQAGRAFTMAIALAGIGTMTWLFSTVTAFILETTLDHAYRRRRMRAQIDALEGHFVVCGAGRIGSYVIEELVADSRKFVVVDADEDVVEARLERHPHLLTMVGDASDDDTLQRAGITRAAGVFAVTGDDAKNLGISLSAKQLNPAVRVVARVHDQRNAAKTLRAGADEIVAPDFTGGHRIASLMIRPQMVSLVDELVRSGGRLAIEEVTVPPRPFPLRLTSLGCSQEWLLVAVRDGSSWRFNPPQDLAVTPGQALVVIASPEGRRDLQAKVSV